MRETERKRLKERSACERERESKKDRMKMKENKKFAD